MITVGWGDFEETLMIYRAEIPWSMREQEDALHACYSMIGEKDHAVNIVIDLRHITVNAYEYMKFFESMYSECPTNVNSIIYITNSIFANKLQLMWQRTHALNRLALYTVSTVDEAYALLEEFGSNNASDNCMPA